MVLRSNWTAAKLSAQTSWGHGLRARRKRCAATESSAPLEKTGKVRFLIRRFQYYSVWKLKHIIFLFLAQNFELFGCKMNKIETLIRFYLCDDSPRCGITFPASFELSTDDEPWCGRCVSAAPCWIRVRAAVRRRPCAGVGRAAGPRLHDQILRLQHRRFTELSFEF